MAGAGLGDLDIHDKLLKSYYENREGWLQTKAATFGGSRLSGIADALNEVHQFRDARKPD
jgi:hypothetical protein